MRKTSSSGAAPWAARSRKSTVPCASSPSRLPTEVAADAELLPGCGSAALPDTLAVLMRMPLAPALTVVLMVTVAEAPSASAPRTQVTVEPETRQVGGPGTVDTNVTAAGSVSATVTSGASDGPALTIVNTY